MLRDFDCHVWSIRTLDRRLRYFDIRYTDIHVAVVEVEEAVTRGMEGTGRLLGFRALQEKVRKVQDLSTARMRTRCDVQRRSSFLEGKDTLPQEKEKRKAI